MCHNLDFVKRAVILAAAMICALHDSAFDVGICFLAFAFVLHFRYRFLCRFVCGGRELSRRPAYIIFPTSGEKIRKIFEKTDFALDKFKIAWYNNARSVEKTLNLGVAQMVARYLGVVEAAGSSPVTQIKKTRLFRQIA